jgi:RNA polymerase sigma factor (sigma-70 family)
MASRRPDPGSAQTIDDDAATLVAVSAERFEELVRPLLRQAFHLAQSMLLDRHEAEDAVQDATLNAWRSFGQFRDHGGGLRPWFLKIVANQCRSRLRSRWWQVWRRAELRDGGGAAAEDGVVLRTDLARAIGRLSMESWTCRTSRRRESWACVWAQSSQGCTGPPPGSDG